jgi:hypothetical protein
MPRNSSLFDTKENASWRVVVRWLDEIRGSSRNRIERKSFEEALSQKEFDFVD